MSSINNNDADSLIIPKELVISASIIVAAIIISTAIVFALAAKGSTTNTATSTPTTVKAATTPTTAASPVDISAIKALYTGDGIKFGNADSKVLFVEVSDPSCPYCSIAGGLNPSLNKQAGSQFLLVADGGTYVSPVLEMKKLVEAGKASFRWIYSNGHGNGELATEALYCANEQGKFWEVNDLLMSDKGYTLLNGSVKNDRGQSGTLAEFLSPAIDSSFMKSCLESKKYNSKLASDQALANSLGVKGTPGFFVNTTKYAGAYSYTDMSDVVDAALSK